LFLAGSLILGLLIFLFLHLIFICAVNSFDHLFVCILQYVLHSQVVGVSRGTQLQKKMCFRNTQCLLSSYRMRNRMGDNWELLSRKKWTWDLHFRWEWACDGNRIKTLKWGGIWYKKICSHTSHIIGHFINIFSADRLADINN